MSVVEVRGALAPCLETTSDASVDLAVLDSDATPYCVASDDPELNRVLSTDWPHELVLSTLPV